MSAPRRTWLVTGGSRGIGRRLHERALAAGVDSTLSIVDGMQHVCPILAGTAPEANEEIQRVARWYKG